MAKKKHTKKVKKNILKDVTFPKDFFMGTSTSAHQVEGDNMFNDWWAWEQKGRVLNRQVSGSACNHYNMYKEDFSMMQDMNHNAHRISIEWSRIEPKEGQFDKEAITHYRNVLKDMRKKGLEPFVTLFHFTIPYWFGQKNGFLNKKTGIFYFNRFVKKLVNEVGDLVTYWITINEPYLYAHHGYLKGESPPGNKSYLKFLKILKNLIYVHIDTYEEIKKIYSKKKWGDTMIGFSKSFVWFDPRHDKHIFDKALAGVHRYFYNKAYFKPFFSGKMPLALGGSRIPKAKKCIDFIGMNYYSRCISGFSKCNNTRYHLQKQEFTLFNWEVYPKGLYNILKYVYRKLNKPIYITENGISTYDDTQRISYLVRHLISVDKAINEGVDVRGYFYWSFIDNFEWAEGYTQPFGLVAMNHRTFERIPKPSAFIYSEICKKKKITKSIFSKYTKQVKDKILNGVS